VFRRSHQGEVRKLAGRSSHLIDREVFNNRYRIFCVRRVSCKDSSDLSMPLIVSRTRRIPISPPPIEELDAIGTLPTAHRAPPPPPPAGSVFRTRPRTRCQKWGFFGHFLASAPLRPDNLGPPPDTRKTMPIIHRRSQCRGAFTGPSSEKQPINGPSNTPPVRASFALILWMKTPLAFRSRSSRAFSGVTRPFVSPRQSLRRLPDRRRRHVAHFRLPRVPVEDESPPVVRKRDKRGNEDLPLVESGQGEVR